eukprot:355379-Rhodomonas_salina.1
MLRPHPRPGSTIRLLSTAHHRTQQVAVHADTFPRAPPPTPSPGSARALTATDPHVNTTARKRCLGSERSAPVPPYLRVVDMSTCLNGCQTWSTHSSPQYRPGRPREKREEQTTKRGCLSLLRTVVQAGRSPDLVQLAVGNADSGVGDLDQDLAA